MAANLNPTDLARDTLRTLATRKLTPTPANFSRVYAELSGTPQAPETAAEPRETAQAWARVVRDLLRQWELKHAGLTAARKKEGLERVLINFGTDPVQLQVKLQTLVTSWSQTPAGRSAIEDEPAPEAVPEGARPAHAARTGPDPVSVTTAEGSAVATATLRDLLSEALSDGLAPRLARFPDLADEARLLGREVAQALDARALAAVGRKLHQFWRKLELRADGDNELISGLTGLLRLLADNIGELVLDEQWVHGQVGMLRDMLVQPMNVQRIQQAERNLRDIIIKQGALKHSLKQAQDAVKTMVADFIRRVGEMSESTGEFHDKIGVYAQRVRDAEDISGMSQALEEFMGETRAMQMDMLRSRDALIAARREVEAAQAKAQALEKELAEVSELVREDHLTGSLNRRGMDDAFEREIARCDRQGSPLCIALLDIDHFKRLNDTYGHDAGDNALVHLVGVVKETIRPTDVIARYGGEEFVIILPDTKAAEAVRVMTRLQRDLTRKFFLHDQERLLITFSAGVAERTGGETAEAVLGRADAALYRAKESGRNRVIEASSPALAAAAG